MKSILYYEYNPYKMDFGWKMNVTYIKRIQNGLNDTS
jgi:hypothetical protein